MPSTISTRVKEPLLALALTLSIPSCQDHDDDPSPGDTDGVEGCPDCLPGQEVYLCIIDGEEKLECFDDLTQAQAVCGLQPGNGVVGNMPVVCDNQTPEPSIPWTPSSLVSYDDTTHTYEIARPLLLDVLEAPSLLLNDRTRLEWRGDRFEFQSIAEGDLADLLGFSNGDVLSKINGYPLSSMEQIATAYDVLRAESEFTVAIVRGEATIVLEYRIVDGT